ncbi:hypothetical protein GCM10023146_35520 [Nocardioides caricicola]
MTGSFLVLRHFDLFEHVYRWSRAHEDLNVDELVMATALAVLLSGFFGWRRYRDANAEAERLTAAERALAETNERYRSLYDLHPDAVFMLDSEGRLVSMNAAAVQMCGYTLEEMSGLTIADYVETHDIPRVTEQFRALLANPIDRLETRVLHKDGSMIEVAVTGMPVLVDGVPVGAYGIAEDITERNALRCDLEYARQVAEDASEAKSLFLANMSHEIRTPLTSVLAASEMLADTVTSEMQQRLVDTMQRSGARLLRLVDDILDFSRVEAGQTMLRDDPFDLYALLDELSRNAASIAEAKGVLLTCTVDPAVPHELLGDADRVSQVVGNLLDNAVKFTDHGYVRLDASLDGSDGEHGTVVIKVEDSGLGMAPEQQERIFEAFRQADPSITRSYGGTGLGLAICKTLVELMGGTITVDSTFAVGTEFTVRVPLGLVAAAAERTPQSA